MRLKKMFHAREDRSRIRRRMVVVFVFFTGSFGILIYRCIHLHLIPDKRLEKIANTQYQAVIPRISPRGTIYDSQGQELSVSIPTISLAARPRKVSEPGRLAKVLSKQLSLPFADIFSKLTSTKKYVWIKRHLTPQEADGLHGLDDPGLEWVGESKRFYPNRELASQILGAVSLDGAGLGGIELTYDKYLRGDETPEVAFRDARGREFEMPSLPGAGQEQWHDVWLTINRAIQFAVEEELKQNCSKFRAKACTGIVLEAQTGAVLGMATYPSFNPNAFQDYDWSQWKNRAVTDGFEPGSIFKVIVAASALESKAVNPDEKFFCENGSYRVGNRVIHDSHPYGMLSFSDIIKVSSNIGTFKVGRRVGQKEVASTIGAFGFGRKTGIDFPGETSGFVRPVSQWREVEFANIAFGQGIRVTPLQMVRAMAIIGAGGEDILPHFVSKVTDSVGKTVWKPILPSKKILKDSTARVLSQMLVRATEEGGTGTLAQIPGYHVAGKTGTAQKIKGRQYSHSDFMSSFVGFVPANNPRLVVLVTVDEPRGSYYGGTVAAPVFRQIAWTALRELGVSPTEKEKGPASVMTASLASLNGTVSLLASSVGSSQKGTPRFIGMSMREVLAVLDDRKISAELIGSGVVVNQNCPPGKELKKGEVCRIMFQASP